MAWCVLARAVADEIRAAVKERRQPEESGWEREGERMRESADDIRLTFDSRCWKGVQEQEEAEERKSVDERREGTDALRVRAHNFQLRVQRRN
jgi:hypothetical protein